MRNALIAVALLVTLSAGSVSAVPFWYSEEEVNAVLTKYCGTHEVTADSYFELDLAVIEKDRHAKILYKVLKDHLKPLKETLDAQLPAIWAKKEDVKRYFGVLYTKEIHDELWLQTRPAKQAAYRKALGELRALLKEHLPLAAKVKRLDHIYDVLKKIARDFKELPAY